MTQALSLARMDMTEGAVVRWLWRGASVAFVIATIVFAAAPGIDLAASDLFYNTAAGSFGGRHLAWVTRLRLLFNWMFYLSILAAVAGLCVGAFARRRRTGLKWSIFFAACLVAGPGLVTNTLFKDQFGRARPHQIVEYGGVKQFTPPLLPVSQCPRNCSFISGEASAIYLPFYAAAVIFPQQGLLLLAAGTIAGSAAGLVRMAQGAHFLSDVIFAGIFMAFVVALLHRLLFGALRAGARRPLPGRA